jgi:SAM-dependent methyltransferase
MTSTYQNAYHAVHLTQNPARAVLWQVLTEYLSPYVPPNAHALELGAGYCYWINAVPATRKVAVDLWEELPKYTAPNVLPLQIDLVQGLGALGQDKFDVALASNLLEHFEPDTAATLCADVFAHLNPGGRFILIQPNFRFAYKHYFDDYTHRAVFTDVSLPMLLAAQGFTIEKVMPRFMPYSLRDGKLPVKPWLIKAYLASPIKPFAGQMLVIAQKKSL